MKSNKYLKIESSQQHEDEVEIEAEEDYIEENKSQNQENDTDSNFDLFDEIEKHRFSELLKEFVNESKDYVQAIDNCISKIL